VRQNQYPPGPVIFGPKQARRGYRLNRFAHSLLQPGKRAELLANPRIAMQKAWLIAEEIELVERRDWLGLIHYGGNIYMMGKIAAAHGLHMLHMGAQMRGEPSKEFVATRKQTAPFKPESTEKR
jgi:gallate dioxygenase